MTKLLGFVGATIGGYAMGAGRADRDVQRVRGEYDWDRCRECVRPSHPPENIGA